MVSGKGKKKSERHHWWPECVSRHWQDESNRIHWLLPDGTLRFGQPRNLGVITNGHYVKLAPGSETTWDYNFEPIFDRVDAAFPELIKWLQSLARNDLTVAVPIAQRFHPQEASDEEIARLVECVLSLAVRSPKNREMAVSVAEQLQGPLPERGRNAIITMSIANSLKQAVQCVGVRGKFVVLYSPHREFIFGDGFYSNLRSPVQIYYRAKILVPITPEICVLHVQPTQYISNPRLSTIVVSQEEADELNKVVQIYARQAIFFRSQKPVIIAEYEKAEHLEFYDHHNTVDALISLVPGVLE